MSNEHAIDAVEQERMLAAHFFPADWAIAVITKGKLGNTKRRNLRARAVEEQAISVLPEGARCGNCAHIARTVDGQICQLHSDSDGIVRTKQASICSWWKAAA